MLGDKSAARTSIVLTLSRSTIDTTLASLRKRLNIRLFSHIKGELIIGRRKQLLCPHTLTLLRRTIRVRRLFHRSGNTVHVCTDDAVNGCVLPTIVTHCHRSCPRLPVRLDIKGDRSIVRTILSFHISVNFVRKPYRDARVVSRP